MDRFPAVNFVNWLYIVVVPVGEVVVRGHVEAIVVAEVAAETFLKM